MHHNTAYEQARAHLHCARIMFQEGKPQAAIGQLLLANEARSLARRLRHEEQLRLEEQARLDAEKKNQQQPKKDKGHRQ
jgi:hypothetical protein